MLRYWHIQVFINKLTPKIMLQNLILAAFGIVSVAVVVYVFLQCHKKDKENEAKWNKVRTRVQNMHDEELIFQWGKYHDAVLAGGVPEIYLHVLDILEDECERRGFKGPY